MFVANTSGLSIAAGDELTIIGNYDEFFDMSQIEVADASGVSKIGSVAPPSPELIADPSTIATGGSMTEDYEGVLVRVENVTVESENPDAPEDFNEFAVTGSLRVDDLFFDMDDWTRPAVGTSFAAISGVLVYRNENFKLEPRDAADLESN